MRATSNFRETLWFLKGQQETEAAESLVRDDQIIEDVPSHTLPIEDRYADNVSLSVSDSLRFGLHLSSVSQAIEVIQRPVAAEDQACRVDDRVLIREMKGSRTKLIAFVTVSLLALCIVIALV